MFTAIFKDGPMHFSGLATPIDVFTLDRAAS